MTSTQCLKVAELRKVHGNNIDLRQWMAMKNNLYVGRSGRIFINGEVFAYSGSKWGNPYRLSDYSLAESLILYRKHIIDSGLINQIGELEGKTLGCYCNQKNPCHAKILVELFEASKA